MRLFILSSALALCSYLAFGQHVIYSNQPNGLPRVPTGPHGQDCSGGALADKCLTWGMVNHVVAAEVACQHNYDCCNCGQILCTDGCVALVCNGDAACFGIKNIVLEGDSMGVGIICNGDFSCQGTYINATNVGEVYCTGDDSCAYSKFNLQCIISHGMGCEVQCNGENSCEGDPLDSRKVAIYRVENSHGMSCGVEGCRWGQFEMLSDTGGTVDCGGNNGCEHSDIVIRGAESISCGGIQSCRHAHIVVMDPVVDGFSITCSGLHACYGLDIEVIITDPEITLIEGIACISTNACEKMKVAVVKHGAAATNGLVIGTMECAMASACSDLRVDLGQHVTVEECHCAAGACDGLTGVPACDGAPV